jgi:uncharacterized protein (TIGR00725 family)
MKIKSKIQIGIIGDSQIQSKEQYHLSYEIGKIIAEKNAILLCGGRGGVMEAACKGVYDEGGISVGILPHDLNDPEINEYLTIRIPTLLHWARNVIVPLASDGIIACGGKAGTLSEIAYSWMYKKPLVCITSISGWSKEIGERGYVDERNGTFKVLTAQTAPEAVEKIYLAVLSSKK